MRYFLIDTLVCEKTELSHRLSFAVTNLTKERLLKKTQSNINIVYLNIYLFLPVFPLQSLQMKNLKPIWKINAEELSYIL